MTRNRYTTPLPTQLAVPIEDQCEVAVDSNWSDSGWLVSMRFQAAGSHTATYAFARSPGGQRGYARAKEIAQLRLSRQLIALGQQVAS